MPNTFRHPRCEFWFPGQPRRFIIRFSRFQPLSFFCILRFSASGPLSFFLRLPFFSPGALGLSAFSPGFFRLPTIFFRFFLFHISFPRKEIGRAGEAARKKNKKK